jgi:MHS family proline/betaine transporter-like MFS transporter
MEAQGQVAPRVDQTTMRRAIAACAIGNATEWFDYTTYGFLAIILGGVFFPSENPTVSLLSSFAVFGAAFVARPLGGFFFGPLGDKFGRQRILATTILLMAGATFAAGLLPGYAAVGIWAPILLVFLRLLQGFSAGGEYGGASTFMAEFAPDDRRGFWTSWLEFGSLTGYFMGAGLATLLTVTLSDGVMSSWGWRIPFLIAGPLGVIGLYLRLKLQDTPVFTALEEAGEVEESPLRDTLVYAWRPMLLLAGISMITNVGNYILLTYMVNYLQNNLNVGSTTALLVTFIAIVFMMVVIWRVGSLSDRFGRKTMLIAGSVGFIVFSLPAFWLISLGNWITTLLGMLMLALCLVLILGTIPSTLPALFPTEVRYTGFAISYNISVALFGGTAPFVAGYLASATGSNYAPAFYLMGIAAVALIPILLSPETARQPLRSGLETPRESPSEASA